WSLVLAVNLSGAFYWCRALLPGMAARGRGAVVNVSSLAGRSKSANGGLAYTASKAGLLGLTRHLAFDYGPRGVRVNAICPGGVDRVPRLGRCVLRERRLARCERRPLHGVKETRWRDFPTSIPRPLPRPCGRSWSSSPSS